MPRWFTHPKTVTHRGTTGPSVLRCYRYTKPAETTVAEGNQNQSSVYTRFWKFYQNLSPHISKCQGYRRDILGCVKPLSQGYKHVQTACAESSHQVQPVTRTQSPITRPSRSVRYISIGNVSTKFEFSVISTHELGAGVSDRVSIFLTMH